MAGRLDNKVAIITGAARGIGRGIARVFVAEGAKVLIVDLDETSGNKTVDELRKMGDRASFFKADVSKKKDTESMADVAITRYGRIDILCQNAGIVPWAFFEDMTEANWDEVNSVNLKGAFLTAKSCLPQMKSQKYGRIVFTSSITGPRTAMPQLAHYGATKAGINGFIRGLAIELAKYNITINGVEPGMIVTERFREAHDDQEIRTIEQSIPLGRLGTPKDVGYTMLFLVSDEAEYITGQTIVVDGGQILPEIKFA